VTLREVIQAFSETISLELLTTGEFTEIGNDTQTPPPVAPDTVLAPKESE